MTKKEEENFRDKNTDLPKFKWCHLFFNLNINKLDELT